MRFRSPASLFLALSLLCGAALPAAAQDVRPPEDAVRLAPGPGAAGLPLPDPHGDARAGGGFTPPAGVRPPEPSHDAIGGARAATGGAQTLDDILARQRGEAVDLSFRKDALGDPAQAAPETQALGTLGGRSDAEIWRGVRYDAADMRTQVRGPATDVLIQGGGMRWLDWRRGPVAHYGGWAMLGTIGLLAVFFALRGRIRIDGAKTGIKVPRFAGWERFGHWLLAGSFVMLGLTGLWTLFGRLAIIGWIGHEAYSPIAIASKWIHNNLAWAFMLGLAWVFVAWVIHNIPNMNDLRWIRVAGGLFSKNVHPPADKFNAGQKMIFWSVIALGVSISVSGLSLLFPFELPLFAATFSHLNDLGVPGLLGMDPFPTALAPQEEMQFAQIWHLIVAFAFMCVVLAHIYIGSIGMEGAYDAMGEGEVEAQWAKEHHGLWYEKLVARGKAPALKGHDHAHPAE